jgi:predicted nucleic acid-binding protein
MKLIIDTNLLFSAISKPDGKIAEIILHPQFGLELIGCYMSYVELFKHKNKILKMSKLAEEELLQVMYQILKRIIFINEGSIDEQTFKGAYELTRDIDEKDTVFVAMSKHLGCKLWSGDKVLVEGLRKKGFTEALFTHELLELITSNKYLA